MTTDIYEQLNKEVITSTEEIFSTMIPIDIKVGKSFMQELAARIKPASNKLIRVSHWSGYI